MSRVDLQVNFRMPAALKDELESLARANRRSLTAEIVARLERSIGEPDDLGISDRERINPESEWYTGEEQERKPTTRISKEKLLASIEDAKPVTRRDLNEAMADAISRLLESLQAGAPNPPKGPTQRKRYPKE